MKVIQTNILKDYFGNVEYFQSAYYEVNITYDELYYRFKNSKNFTENILKPTMKGIGKFFYSWRFLDIAKVDNSDFHFKVSYERNNGISETWVYIIKED